MKFYYDGFADIAQSLKNNPIGRFAQTREFAGAVNDCYDNSIAFANDRTQFPIANARFFFNNIRALTYIHSVGYRLRPPDRTLAMIAQMALEARM